MLKLGVREVAELAKVTPNTVSRIEQDDAGPRGAQALTVDAIRRVYEDRGIVFLADGEATVGGPGVRIATRSEISDERVNALVANHSGPDE